MALLLRTISNPKWALPDWIEAGEVPADVLSDLRPSGNTLSVWSVEPDRANLGSILAAVASARDRLDKIDYTLIDEGLLQPIPIKCARSEANTPHLTANTAHRDLTELTVNKVARLAHEMIVLERMRLTPNQVRTVLSDALRRGTLDRARMKRGLLEEVESPA